MRVITGEARGHTLKGPASDATRPTSDKVRGAIFSMLASMVCLEGARVLDLYAGTGALGIEALSRGAAHCDLVDHDRAACRVIGRNLEHTKLTHLAAVHCMAVERIAATPFTRAAEYDIILVDPPYGDARVWPALEKLAAALPVTPDAVLVLEHSKRTAPPARLGPLELLRTRRYGDTCVSLYRAPQVATGGDTGINLYRPPAAPPAGDEPTADPTPDPGRQP
jgi:16S rRNA (guanine(966)-N(2))-methyltransferase RsmD